MPMLLLLLFTPPAMADVSWTVAPLGHCLVPCGPLPKVWAVERGHSQHRAASHVHLKISCFCRKPPVLPDTGLLL